MTTIYLIQEDHEDKELQPVCLKQPQHQQQRVQIRSIGPFILIALIVGLIILLPQGLRMLFPVSQPEGPRDYEVTAIIQTADGGFALTGGLKTTHGAWCILCAANAYEGRDMWLLKTDPNGVMIWNQSYGGPDAENPCALVQTTDGGFALAGWTGTPIPGDRDMLLVKTDPNGVMIWNQSYGGPDAENPCALVQTTDGGFALVGSTESFGEGAPYAPNMMWLVKTDANGNEQWNHTYAGTGYNLASSASSVSQTADGGYAIAGCTDSYLYPHGYHRDMLLVKTDATGNLTWHQTYGGTEDDEANTLVQTADGGFALTGFTESFGAGNEDMWLVKTDATGNVSWHQTYGGPEVDIAYTLVQTADGGFALVGSTSSFGPVESIIDQRTSNMWLVKTDATGNHEWNQTYGGPDEDSSSVLVQTTDGGFALAGFTGLFDPSMWLVKTDATGNHEWNQTYRDPEWSEVTATSTPGWGPISLLVAAVVLTTWYKKHKKLE